MMLKKSDIVNSISNHAGFTKRQSVETMETLLEIIKKTLESGEDVLISGFGKFCVKNKKKRRGRDKGRISDNNFTEGFRSNHIIKYGGILPNSNNLN